MSCNVIISLKNYTSHTFKRQCIRTLHYYHDYKSLDDDIIANIWTGLKDQVSCSGIILIYGDCFIEMFYLL